MPNADDPATSRATAAADPAVCTHCRTPILPDQTRMDYGDDSPLLNDRYHRYCHMDAFHTMRAVSELERLQYIADRAQREVEEATAAPATVQVWQVNEATGRVEVTERM
jgi:hypothetical protein